MTARRAGVSAVEHAWSRIDVRGPDECWPHRNASVRGGYVQIRVEDRRVYAHVWAYEQVHGPVPEGHEVDHLCHGSDASCVAGDDCPHRRCCNPAHLEAVTPSVNGERARQPQALRSHCPAGHPYDEANTCHSGGRRHCRSCQRERARAARLRGGS